MAYKRASRFADAKRTIAAAQAQNLDSPDLHDLLFDIAIVEEDRQVIQREISWSRDKPPVSRSLEYQGIYEADQGHFGKAEVLFRDAVAQGVKDVGLNYARACATTKPASN